MATILDNNSVGNGTTTYVKVPNYPGLYRHSRSGRYYGFKKLHGKRRECSLRTTDRKIAERRLREWIGNLQRVDRERERTTLRELLERFVAVNQDHRGVDLISEALPIRRLCRESFRFLNPEQFGTIRAVQPLKLLSPRNSKK
jgi:hypothetical protein